MYPAPWSRHEHFKSSYHGTSETNRLGTMRLQVPSLASLSALRIWHCRELWCRSQMWLGSGIAVAVAVAGSYSPDSTPSLGPSICHGCSPKKQSQKKKKQNPKNVSTLPIPQASLCFFLVNLLATPGPSQSLICFQFSLHFFFSLEFHINRINTLLYLSYFAQHNFLRFVHFVASVSSWFLFFFLSNIPLMAQWHCHVLIHGPFDGCLDCFRFEVLKNKSAENMYVWVFEQIHIFISFGLEVESLGLW